MTIKTLTKSTLSFALFALITGAQAADISTDSNSFSLSSVTLKPGDIRPTSSCDYPMPCPRTVQFSDHSLPQ